MSYRLPPLNSLRLFEAAGRLLSFKLAAEEVNLTPSAISHGIKGLEDWLGVDLFVRGRTGLSLTEAGAAYLPVVRDTLEGLAIATRGLTTTANRRRIVISVAPSFALRVLVPGLSRFEERHPDIEIAFDTARQPVALPRDGVDIAIRMGMGDWDGLDAACLTAEFLVPAAAPALASRVRTADDLRTQRLIHVTSVSEDWAAWTALAGIDDLSLDGGQRFETIDMALAAAASSGGFVIGRLPLVAEDFTSGRLQPVLGPPRKAQTGYWFVTLPDTRIEPRVRAVFDWLGEEIDALSTRAAAYLPA